MKINMDEKKKEQVLFILIQTGGFIVYFQLIVLLYKHEPIIIRDLCTSLSLRPILLRSHYFIIAVNFPLKTKWDI
jgi:hypothetical protein